MLICGRTVCREAVEVRAHARGIGSQGKVNDAADLVVRVQVADEAACAGRVQAIQARRRRRRQKIILNLDARRRRGEGRVVPGQGVGARLVIRVGIAAGHISSVVRQAHRVEVRVVAAGDVGNSQVEISVRDGLASQVGENEGDKEDVLVGSRRAAIVADSVAILASAKAVGLHSVDLGERDDHLGRNAHCDQQAKEQGENRGFHHKQSWHPAWHAKNSLLQNLFCMA